MKSSYASVPGGGMDEEAGKRWAEEMKDPNKKAKWLKNLNKKSKQFDKRAKK